MLKKEITFNDFNGNEVTKVFYFNLSVDETLELGLSYDGGLESYIQRLIESEDVMEIYQILKKIVLMSYGEKSDDGLRFIKTLEAQKAFSETNAFSDLMFSFIQKPEEAAKFINAIVPNDKIEEMTDSVSGNNVIALNNK